MKITYLEIIHIIHLYTYFWLCICVCVFVPYDLGNYRTNHFVIWRVGTLSSNLGFFRSNSNLGRTNSSKTATSFREDMIWNLENVFDQEMKRECIKSQPCLPRVRRRPRISEETSFQIISVKFGTLENVFVREMKSEWKSRWRSTPSELRFFVKKELFSWKLKTIVYSRERFSFGKWRMNVFKHTYYVTWLAI